MYLKAQAEAGFRQAPGRTRHDLGCPYCIECFFWHARLLHRRFWNLPELYFSWPRLATPSFGVVPEARENVRGGYFSITYIEMQ